MSTEVYATFLVGPHYLAVPASSFSEVLNYPEHIYSIANSPDYLSGFFNLREDAIPLIKLSHFFASATISETEEKYVAVINIGDKKIGLEISAIREVLRTNSGSTIAVSYSENSSVNLVKTILKHPTTSDLIQIIDLGKLFEIKDIPYPQNSSLNKLDESHKLNTYKKEKALLVSCHNTNIACSITAINEVVIINDRLQKSLLNDPYCIGFINLRDNIVPVLCGSKMFGIEANSETPADKAIVFKAEKGYIAIAIQNVTAIFDFYPEKINGTKIQSLDHFFHGYVDTGLNKEKALLLNTKKMLDHKIIHSHLQGHRNLYATQIHSTNLASEILQSKHQKSIETITSKFTRSSLITFTVEQKFAVQLNEVFEVTELAQKITKAPIESGVIKGVFRLREHVVSLFDFRELYAFPAKKKSDELSTSENETQKVIVFDFQNEKLGLIVDEMGEILNFGSNLSLPIPNIFSAKLSSKLHSGVKEIIRNPNHKDELIVVLNIPSIFKFIFEKIAEGPNKNAG